MTTSPALIPLLSSQIGAETVQTVNARDLHRFLESKRQFANWIKDRIQQYDFTQDVDFIAINNSVTSPPSIDYHLSLDMAKELAMVERNAKGKQARLYFIECERKARETPAFTPARVLLEHAKKLVEIEDRQFALEAEQERLANEQHSTASQVKALVDGEGYFTVVGMANRVRARVDEREAARLGSLASGQCRQKGVMIGKAPHPRYGYCNTYPEEILEEVFKDEGLIH